MLKQVNPLLTNNEIPLEILNTVEELLENKDIGRNGYISIILTPVQDDTSDILEELNLDHTLVRIPDNNFLQIDIKNKKHPMNENRRWVSYTSAIPKKRDSKDFFGCVVGRLLSGSGYFNNNL